MEKAGTGTLRGMLVLAKKVARLAQVISVMTQSEPPLPVKSVEALAPVTLKTIPSEPGQLVVKAEVVRFTSYDFV